MTAWAIAVIVFIVMAIAIIFLGVGCLVLNANIKEVQADLDRIVALVKKRELLDDEDIGRH